MKRKNYLIRGKTSLSAAIIALCVLMTPLTLKNISASDVNPGVTLDSNYKFSDNVKFSAVKNFSSGIYVYWNKLPEADKYVLYRKKAGEKLWEIVYEGTALSYIDTDTVGGQSYVYGISAGKYVKSNTCYSSTTQSDAIVAYPAKSEELSARLDSSGVRLDWSAVKGANYYTLYRRRADDNNWKVLADYFTDVSYLDQAACDGKDYYYAVRASSKVKDACYNGMWKIMDTPVTSIVSGVTVNTITVLPYSTGVNISWTYSGNANGFKIYRKASGESDYVQIAQIAGKASFVRDTDTSAGVEYTYMICDAMTGQKFYSGAVTALPAPPNIEFPEITRNYIKLSWKQPKGVQSYTLYRKRADSDRWAELESNIAQTEYCDGSVVNGIEYNYAIKASCTTSAGNRLYSDFSVAKDPVISQFEGKWNYNVTEVGFGANGSDQADDTRAIQSALNKAQAYNGNGCVNIKIPEGTYYISKPLEIFSHTRLDLANNAQIVRLDTSKVMLKGSHTGEDKEICQGEGCTHGGYSQLEGVTISGGLWNGNVTSTDAGCAGLFTFAHARTLNIINTTLSDCCGMHMVNVDGVSGIGVYGVTFRNFYKYTGGNTEYYGGKAADPASYDDYDKKEALHIDYVGASSSPIASPLDPLACDTVMILNNTFENCVSAVGTHNGSTGLSFEKVNIASNTFRNIEYNAINIANYNNLTIMSNNAENMKNFIKSYGASKGVIKFNSAKNCDYAVHPDNIEGLAIENNNFQAKNGN